LSGSLGIGDGREGLSIPPHLDASALFVVVNVEDNGAGLAVEVGDWSEVEGEFFGDERPALIAIGVVTQVKVRLDRKRFEEWLRWLYRWPP